MVLELMPAALSVLMRPPAPFAFSPLDADEDDEEDLDDDFDVEFDVGITKVSVVHRFSCSDNPCGVVGIVGIQVVGLLPGVGQSIAVGVPGWAGRQEALEEPLVGGLKRRVATPGAGLVAALFVEGHDCALAPADFHEDIVTE